MKTKRSSQRSFPGRLTLEEWLALPGLGRRDMIHRAQCELLHCQALCAGRQCRRHRTCCGDDVLACRERLWQRAPSRPLALRRELRRLENLGGLPGPARGIDRGGGKSVARSVDTRVLWTATFYDPWNAPALFPGETQRLSLSSSAHADDPVIADTRSFCSNASEYWMPRLRVWSRMIGWMESV